MKKLLLSVFAALALSYGVQAQKTKTTVKQQVKTEKKAADKVSSEKKAETKKIVTDSKGTVLKKDGTPDKRYKKKVKIKKDGTPDRRYKENK